MLQALLQPVFVTGCMAAALVISSGQTDWPAAWIYICLSLCAAGSATVILALKNPPLLRERSNPDRCAAKALDRLLAGIIAFFGPLSILVTAGLDRRFDWSPPFGRECPYIALAVMLTGAAITVWAMTVNRFFYAFVEIRKDAGHTVITEGPYRYVRHPGYSGMILFTLATPLLLGSTWALLPAFATVSALLVRTRFEDRTLHRELAGYGEYAARVPCRLFPELY